jgi:uncharacterized FAD-dependent dehydrogenase
LRLEPDECLALEASLRRRVKIPKGKRIEILRRSIDARHRQVRVVLSLALVPDAPPAAPASPLRRPGRRRDRRVVVVGAGPAGLFAALALIEAGLNPVVVDRGAAFPHRHLLAKELRLAGRQDGPCAMTCGLGGAGTFSDGKLHTRKGGALVERALRILAWFGQDPDLLIDGHPHVGSNRLPRLVERIREHLEENGCRFFFSTEAAGLAVRNGRVAGIRLQTGETLASEAVVLAPGNNARALFRKLLEQGVAMEQKAFAVGLRVEHPRELIDRSQYGDLAGHPVLGAARYAFAFPNAERPVYSFCMCPGGYVIPTPPETGRLAVNGMSFAPRSSRWSNSAVVAAVSPLDWGDGSDPVLGGLEFQRRIEEACFEAGGGGYRAPAQRLTDFLAARPSGSLPESSYRPGIAPARIGALLPEPVTRALKEGLLRAARGIPGFITAEALVLAPETLTSSPVRLPRDPQTGQSPSHTGLFPCGEGSGWAGGITSSAADGLASGQLVARYLGAL